MRKLLFGLLAAMPFSSFAQGLVEQVEVVNVPLPVEANLILPADLRSSTATVVAKPGDTKQTVVSFNDLLVGLLDVNWVTTETTKSGYCRVQIDINDKIAKVWIRQPPITVEIRQPPVGIEGAVEVEVRQPPIGIAGDWGPPNGLVLTPNDTITLEVASVDTKKNEKGQCAVEFVVLGESKFTITDGQ